MKRKLTNNISLKILSVFLAIMLWLVVINVSDPEKTSTINNIPITIINEESITGQEMVYEVLAGAKASVQVTGPRTIIDSLDAQSFTATADLSKLSKTGAVEVEVELVTPSYRSKVDIDVKTTMKVSVEDLLHKEFVAEVYDKGSLAEGYVIYGRKMEDSVVEVIAPESVMATIAKVCVAVDVTGAKDDFTVNAKFQAYDNRGIVINAEKNNIKFSVEETSVDVTVYPIKQIPFVYEIDEDKYPDAIITSTNISRQNIMVVGRTDSLSKIDEIVLDTSSLNIIPEQSSYELSYTLKDLLPEGVLVYGEDKTVSIKVETDAIISKSFNVPVNDIAIKSLGDGLSAAHETTGTLTYTLKGRKSILDIFVVEDNPLFVSTKNLGVGDYNLEVVMDLEEGLELVAPIYVQVKISEKEKPTESTTDEVSTEPDTNQSTTAQTTTPTSPTTTKPTVNPATSSTSQTTSSTTGTTTKSTEDTTTTTEEDTTETVDVSQTTEPDTTQEVDDREDIPVDGGVQ